MDLNLFAVFDAIMRHNSVSRAAENLGLTQSATSNALTRLRAELGDPLFMRSKNGMLPTSFAREMAPAIEQALAGLRQVSQIQHDDEPQLSSLRRTFTLMMSDLEEALFLSDLMRDLTTVAPAVSIEIHPFRGETLQDELELERIDLVIANLRLPIKNVVSQHLLKQDFVCAVRSDHPVTTEIGVSLGSQISLDEYLRHGHILVSPDRGGRRGVIDEHLREMGKQRRVVGSVPHFLSACLLISNSDYVIALPRRLAEMAQAYFPLKLLELPFAAASFPIALHWLRTRQRDREHAWFRKFVSNSLAQNE